MIKCPNCGNYMLYALEPDHAGGWIAVLTCNKCGYSSTEDIATCDTKIIEEEKK